jgi:hypothetical protein
MNEKSEGLLHLYFVKLNAQVTRNLGDFDEVKVLIN